MAAPERISGQVIRNPRRNAHAIPRLGFLYKAAQENRANPVATPSFFDDYLKYSQPRKPTTEKQVACVLLAPIRLDDGNPQLPLMSCVPVGTRRHKAERLPLRVCRSLNRLYVRFDLSRLEPNGNCRRWVTSRSLRSPHASIPGPSMQLQKGDGRCYKARVCNCSLQTQDFHLGHPSTE